MALGNSFRLVLDENLGSVRLLLQFAPLIDLSSLESASPMTLMTLNRPPGHHALQCHVCRLASETPSKTHNS